jgi:hypothetical protein
MLEDSGSITPSAKISFGYPKLEKGNSEVYGTSKTIRNNFNALSPRKTIIKH